MFESDGIYIVLILVACLGFLLYLALDYFWNKK